MVAYMIGLFRDGKRVTAEYLEPCPPPRFLSTQIGQLRTVGGHVVYETRKIGPGGPFVVKTLRDDGSHVFTVRIADREETR